MFVESDSAVWQLVSKIAVDEGLALYDLERVVGGLRVFVEKDDVVLDSSLENEQEERKQAGVDSEDCARLCRRLLTFFSVEGADLGFGSGISLEISSPGINRQLRLGRHFGRAIGKNVRVQFDSGFEDGRRTVIGIIEKFENDTIFVRDSEEVDKGSAAIEIPLSAIVKARVEFSFGSSGRVNRKVSKQVNDNSKHSSRGDRLKTFRH